MVIKQQPISRWPKIIMGGEGVSVTGRAQRNHSVTHTTV
jgi:hypothetical protein